MNSIYRARIASELCLALAPGQLHSCHSVPPLTHSTCDHHHHSCPSLPQLGKRHPCVSHCSWKKLWLLSPPLPCPHHFQSISMLTLWTLPLKNTPPLTTSQQLWYFWPDPGYHYLSWPIAKAFYFHFLTCLLRSVLQTTARVIVLKHKSKPSNVS